jgi:hypothetical protein
MGDGRIWDEFGLLMEFWGMILQWFVSRSRKDAGVVSVCLWSQLATGK